MLALLRPIANKSSRHPVQKLKMSSVSGISSSLSSLLSAVAAKKLVNDNTPSVDVFDLDYFRGRLDSAKSAFPEPFFCHAVALKANSIRGILNVAREKGFGAECASISEAVHALALGFAADTVVFDSPCKTRVDLKTALDADIVVNLDNEREMAMVDELLASSCSGSKAKIGLRINPVVGAGNIQMFSVSTSKSKFGLPVTEDTRETIIDLYKKYEWLTGIHIHVGSQGQPLEHFVQGTRICVDFVKDVESKCGRSLETIDIGGGLSSSYTDPDEPAGFAYSEYRRRLEETAPELFTGKYRIITEFGRSLFLKAGKTLTRVEYVKHWIKENNPIILTNVGSNQFVREVYRPDVWKHRFSLADSDGNVKEGGDLQEYDIAGPLCFQGDYLAKEVLLPAAAAVDDILIMHDTGGYAMALYSKYNSILPSPVYAFSKQKDGAIKFWCLKERETYEETLAFWGRKEPRELA